MALPHFDGDGDVTAWVTTLSDHFEANNTPEDQRLPLARALLSPDVQSCINKVQTVIETITGEEWVLTWARLELALISVQTQIREVEKAKVEAILKAVAIGGVGLLVSIAAPFAFLGAIGAMGFGAGGVAAGSMAAAIQSSIGAVEAGSLFAFCQSAAAGGAALGLLGTAGAATGATAVVVGSAAGAEEWNRIKTEKPSGSWGDGQEFRPALEVIQVLTSAPL